MKKLLALLLVISSISFAKQKDFDLKFEHYNDRPSKLIYDYKDWQRVAHKDDYVVYVEKNIVGTSEEILHFHALTIYNEPFYYDTLKDVVEKIYTYGVLNCKVKQLAIVNEFYVKVDESIIYTANYEYGSNILEMDEPNSIGFDILSSICNKTI